MGGCFCGPSEASAELLVCGRRGLGVANANLRNVDLRVGLGASGCSGGLAGMIGHARRVSRHVIVKIVTLHVLSVNRDSL